MTKTGISAHDPYPRRRVRVLDSEIAYVDTGAGVPVVFLHGNPTSSYLWRNVLPEVEGGARCLAPDLIGMGESGDAPGGAYRFVDHAKYLDAWFDALDLSQDVVLVGHDWGCALAFHWARRHPDRVAGMVYFEGVVKTRAWSEMPDATRAMFRAMRSEEGDDMILRDNYFVEEILPARSLRRLSEEEMSVYRRRFAEPGESRRPTLTWPREIPIDGEPADVAEIVDGYSRWLTETPIPKLFINGEPGGVLTGDTREFCRSFPCQDEVTVDGVHYLPEDSPREIGRAIASFLERLGSA